MLIKKLEVGNLMSNCYIIGCQDTSEAVVIDPGAEPDTILAVLEENNLKLKYIINTHGHVDHMGANEPLQKATSADILIHEEDAQLFHNPQENLSMFVGGEVLLSPPQRLLKEGDTITFGNITLKVIHTPGHTRGGISLYTDQVVFTGDTLFAGSIGRTDLPGGDYKEIIRSIKEKILPLGDETNVCPGHGPVSSVAKEKKTNPFLR
ncbi:MAG: MBL fold metallo-hydrolase [Candidatus Syntrophonatronum acetioxidans]|uniref:MBL fold metallo-hydrolase n=1 Tax=Candidatus Syntrophonatronum acetioxidans TaxID=1795816 RepID=A0A424YFT0_9FIRM|nr:MAG: MBL fold metallo-hydrolase [Candidatus Syntrophonatronum acetioxidans]